MSDNELIKRIHEEDLSKKLIIKPSERNDFFEDEQVRSCSIDLRLSAKIWIEKKNFLGIRKMIDLRDSFCDNQDHSYFWEEKNLPSDGYILKPGQCILARVDEEIQIPLDCLGKIESRSGMNRLLIVITLGDFVNPGYKGHQPLQIINMSRHKIKLYPRMSVCQLLLSELSSEPKKRFSESASSYYQDSGGPARWWEDRQRKLFMKDAALEKRFLNEIISLCNKNGLADDTKLIKPRFKKFYSKRRLQNKSLDSSVKEFLVHEKKMSNKNQGIIKVLKTLQGLANSLTAIGTLIGIVSNLQKSNVAVSNSEMSSGLSKINMAIPQWVVPIIIFVLIIIAINIFLTLLIHIPTSDKICQSK